MRHIILQYLKEILPNVLKVMKEIKQIGVKHNASAGQVTLAWLLTVTIQRIVARLDLSRSGIECSACL